MKFFKLIIFFVFQLLPFNLKKLINIHKLPYSIYKYTNNILEYVSKHKRIKESHFGFDLRNISINPYDRFESSGNVPKHYFFQDIWAAKKVFSTNPSVHHDIGSRLDGFISHCLVFTNVVMLDIRELGNKIENLHFIKVDATCMKDIPSDSIESISSLHAIEHFGLGRYGDPINPSAYIEVIKEIQRVACKDIYISVPIGIQRLVFDSHRVFSCELIIELFDKSNLKNFSYIDDKNVFYEDALIEETKNFEYGCGLFHFVKN